MASFLSRPGVAIAALVTLSSAPAQTTWRDVAVPYYTPPAYVTGQLQHAYRPRAHAFEAAAAALTATVREGCTAPGVRARYVDALLAWDRLSAAAVGPLLQRRSQRRIDFMPTRPESIERAIALAPQGEADLERVGSAAKGFPALEWLLFRRADRGGAACRYAGELAADIEREARALATAFDAAAAQELDDEQTVAAMSEAVNQWIGGLDQLRLQAIERPIGEAGARHLARPAFPRDASGASADERRVRWQALRAQAVFEGRDAPAAGEALVPLEAYLRGKGLNPLADRLAAAVHRVDATIGASGQLQAASRALASLKTLAEAEVAPALDIRVGFSDADGD